MVIRINGRLKNITVSSGKTKKCIFIIDWSCSKIYEQKRLEGMRAADTLARVNVHVRHEKEKQTGESTGGLNKIGVRMRENLQALTS